MGCPHLSLVGKNRRKANVDVKKSVRQLAALAFLTFAQQKGAAGEAAAP